MKPPGKKSPQNEILDQQLNFGLTYRLWHGYSCAYPWLLWEGLSNSLGAQVVTFVENEWRGKQILAALVLLGHSTVLEQKQSWM